ncbi:MAG: tetratricopeptide repeat protein [Candidatus Hermodarchaeota archaeon]
MKISNDISDLIEKARTFKKQNKFDEALRILNEIYTSKPNSEEIKTILIETLFDYGGYLNDYYTLEYEKAKEVFERIINLSPNNYRAHYNLGLAFFNLSKFQNAENSFKKALSIKPDYKYCFYNLGLIYETKEKYKKALQYYEKALKIDPNFIYALTARSEMRKRLDEIK